MPVAAERTAIGGALPFDPGEQGRVERIALGPIPPLAAAAVFPFIWRRFFHRSRISGYERTAVGANFFLGAAASSWNREGICRVANRIVVPTFMVATVFAR
jgi:hypothetical protein